MKLALDAPAVALLTELIRRGVELRADGHRLRYRPRSAVTPALAARIAARKPELLALLTAGNPATTHYTADEYRMLADAPGELRAVVDAIKTTFPTAELIRVDRPSGADIGGVRATDLPPDWREVYEERAAIMEYDGNLPRPQAETEALADTLRMMNTTAKRK